MVLIPGKQDTLIMLELGAQIQSFWGCNSRVVIASLIAPWWITERSKRNGNGAERNVANFHGVVTKA